MSNEQEKNNSALPDYAKDVNTSFLKKLLESLSKKTPQALPGNIPEKTPVTHRSIFSMWNFGAFRTSLFGALDSVRNAVFKPKSEGPKNKFNTVIIGNDHPKEATLEQVESREATQDLQSSVAGQSLEENSDINNNSGEADSSTTSPLTIAKMDTSAVLKNQNSISFGNIEVSSDPKLDDNDKKDHELEEEENIPPTQDSHEHDFE